MGKVSHSFDRFYVVTKFELPKVEDLQFEDIPYDAEYAHLDNPKPDQIIGVTNTSMYLPQVHWG